MASFCRFSFWVNPFSRDSLAKVFFNYFVFEQHRLFLSFRYLSLSLISLLFGFSAIYFRFCYWLFGVVFRYFVIVPLCAPHERSSCSEHITIEVHMLLLSTEHLAILGKGPPSEHYTIEGSTYAPLRPSGLITAPLRHRPEHHNIKAAIPSNEHRAVEAPEDCTIDGLCSSTAPSRPQP